MIVEKRICLFTFLLKENKGSLKSIGCFLFESFWWICLANLKGSPSSHLYVLHSSQTLPFSHRDCFTHQLLNWQHGRPFWISLRGQRLLVVYHGASHRVVCWVQHHQWRIRSKQDSRWWFQKIYMVTLTWGNDPIWRTFFKWVAQPPSRDSLQPRLVKVLVLGCGLSPLIYALADSFPHVWSLNIQADFSGIQTHAGKTKQIHPIILGSTEVSSLDDDILGTIFSDVFLFEMFFLGHF